ncbi:alpha/beta fold hydrolase [Nonomuraea diastatica]|uniref:Alpha/beta fold hydrolase n=1 Tax=Nonomuraea diastatica TaxID=1848329 RepID=A0A4R4WCC5_9ACTN|nr:alpha/beta fold hydrolase [Nonomuraea diastatica]TDD13624.1 alpha/beta fold hydrolase [Nonomuraea diastatica]
MRGRTSAAAIVLVTALAGLLAPAAPAISAAEGGPAAGSDPAAERPATIGWRACPGKDVPQGMRCASLEVPLDWSDTDGKKITLDLARLPATGQGSRIGSVLHVPGGPGSKGIEDLKRFAPDLAELRRRFDLVAYNPRNTDLAAKLPEVCARPAVPHLAEPRTRAEYDAQAAAFARAMRSCAEHDRSGLFTRLDSIAVARDMEAIRAVLGERKLSFMAASYGGVPAAAYMRLFPQRIRAMYLDGVINQPDGWHDQMLVGYPALERMFTRFTTWCAATAACALHGEDAGRAWRALTRRADRTPIPVTSEEFGRGRLTGSSLRWFGFPFHPGPEHERWLSFADAVDKARRGDGSGFAHVLLGNARVWSMPLAVGMTCGDDRRYHGYAEFKRMRAQGREASPNFGGSSFDLLGCTGWPYRVANPARPLPTAGLPPLLGAGTWTDHPLTDSLVRRVPGSTTIRYEGPGHVLYMSGDRCTIGHATRYLVDLTLPPPGTVCRPGQKENRRSRSAGG